MNSNLHENTFSLKNNRAFAKSPQLKGELILSSRVSWFEILQRIMLKNSMHFTKGGLNVARGKIRSHGVDRGNKKT